MADKKISELVELTTPSATDKLPIVDGSETKYIEYQNLVPNQATDLSYTASPTNGTVVSSTGTDATIPLATNTDAGLLTPAEKTVVSNTSGTNTGDETQTTIETKLGFGSVTALTIAFFNATKNLISATGSNLGTFFQSFNSKSLPIDDDTIIVNDSASSFEAKKTTLTQFKEFLKTYFDTIYAGTSGLTNTYLPKFNGTILVDSIIKETNVGSGSVSVAGYAHVENDAAGNASTIRTTLAIMVLQANNSSNRLQIVQNTYIGAVTNDFRIYQDFSNPFLKVSNGNNSVEILKGAKIGNNTDTPIVSGGGTILWNGKSFDVGDGVGGSIEYYMSLITRKYTAYSFTTSTVITTTAIVLNSFAVGAKGVNDISLSTLRAGSVIKFRYLGVLSADIANGTRTINVKLGTVQVLTLACTGGDSNFSSGSVLTIEGEIILDTTLSTKGNLLVNFGSTKANYVMAATTATNIAAFTSGSLNIELINNNVETSTILGSTFNIEITK